MDFQKNIDSSMIKWIDNILGIFVLIACFIYGLLSFIIGVNVIGRIFLHKPLKGTVEIVEILMVFIGFFSIAFATKNRSHVTVRLFVNRLPKDIQKIILSIGFLLSSLIVGIIAYQAIINTIYYTLHLEQTTSIFFIPLAPLKFIMALGCLLIFILLILDFLHPLKVEKIQEGGPHH